MNCKFKQLCFYFLAIQLISGCIVNPVKQTILPGWVQTPPQSNHAFFATGSGISLFEAEKNSRLSLASQIKVNVSDKLETRTILDGSFYREYFDQQTSVKVTDISLAQALVVKQVKQGRNWYVLIQLERQALVSQQQRQLNQNIHTVQAVMRQQDNPSFGRWWRLRQQLITANDALDQLAFLQGLGVSPKPQNKKLLALYFKNLNASEAFLSVAITDRSHIKGLKAVIDHQLSSSRIKHNRGYKRNPELRLSTRVETQKIGSEYYVTTRLSIQLRNNGQVLAETLLKAESVGLRRSTSAIQKNKQKLLTKIRKLNVINQLISQSDEQKGS